MILRSKNIVICLALNMRMFVVSRLLIKWFYPAATLETVSSTMEGSFFFALLEQISSGTGITIETVLERQTRFRRLIFKIKQYIRFSGKKNSVTE